MKRVQKILLLVSVLAMVFGQTLTASAASQLPTVSKVNSIVDADNTSKRANSLTLYTNEGLNEKTVQVTYTWTKPEFDTVSKSTLKVAPANRGIANAAALVETNTELDKINNGVATYKTTATLKITAVNNGSTKINLQDSNKKTKATIKVTVKTLSDSIDSVDEMYVGEKGTVALSAAAVADNGKAVSKGGVTYKVTAAKDADGKDVAAKKLSSVVTVDSKGNVKAKDKMAGATATVTITSKDSDANSNRVIKKEVTVHIVKNTVTSLKGIDEKATKPSKVETNKVNVAMKANVKNPLHTYQILWKANDGATEEDLVFATSKASVATVDEKGLITAVGTGKANITVTPKLGNSLKVTYAVTVSTDADSLNVAAADYWIVADNKEKAAIVASTNPTAKNKAVGYEIVSALDADGNVIEAANIKNYFKLSKNVVTAKQPGHLTVRVYAKDSAYYNTYNGQDKYVTVHASNPVKNILFAENDKASYTVNVYRTSSDQVEAYDLSTLKFVSSIEGQKPDNTAFEISSKKYNGAYYDYDTNKIMAWGNGKTVFNIQALDGSKKKATLTVNVKTDAHTMRFNNIFYDQDEDGNAIKVLYVEADKKTDLKKLLGASVNEDASVKGITYSPASVTLANPDDTATVTVTSTDGRTHGIKGAAANPISETIIVKAVDKDAIATEFELAVNEDRYLTKGDKGWGDAWIANSNGIILNGDVTWSSSNKNAVAVNAATGEITAKAVTQEPVTITATLKADTSVKASYKVTVGRSLADVQKELNTYFANTLKAENRDYLGAKVVFDSKYSAFNVDITEPDTVIADWKDTGLEETLKTLPPTIRSVVVSSYTEDKQWTITRNGMNFDVTIGEDEFHQFTKEEMIDYLKSDILSVYPTLADWNGAAYSIDIEIEETVAGHIFNYTANYFADAMMSASLYESRMDAKISAAVSDFVNGQAPSLTDMGLNAVTYDAAKNTFVVDVLDGAMKIADADAMARDVVVAAMKDVLDKANAVNLTVEVPGNGSKIFTVNRTEENTTEAYINEMIDKYLEKAAAIGEEYAAFDGVKVTASVVFMEGYRVYEAPYEVLFTVGSAAKDYAVDKAIAAEAAKAYDFGNVTYDAAKNTLAVYVTKDFAEKKPEDFLIGQGFGTILEKMIEDNGVTKATVRGINGTTVMLTGDDVNKTQIQLSILNGEDGNMYEGFHGKAAIVKVTYNDQFTVSYTITFTVEEPEAPEAPEQPEQPTVSGNEPEAPVEPEEPTVSDGDTVSGN